MIIKHLIFLFCFLSFSVSQAKIVRFEVDLSNTIPSVNGVHLSGDFQAMLGFGPDWDPSTLALIQVGSSSIYRVVLHLPAFKKYEYRFVNGVHSYEAEFVPDASRLGWVNGSYSDNRWVYVDSLDNDTLKIGAILFGENAPLGKKLIRYQVDLSDAAGIAIQGVHVGTSYMIPAFVSTTSRMYNIRPFEFDIIHYADTGIVDYIYYNGNASFQNETVPSACQVNGKRRFHLLNDTVLPLHCFSSCGVCLTAELSENQSNSTQPLIFPNPANKHILLSIPVQEMTGVKLYNSKGELIREIELNGQQAELALSGCEAGIYLIRVYVSDGKSYCKTLLVQAE